MMIYPPWLGWAVSLPPAPEPTATIGAPAASSSHSAVNDVTITISGTCTDATSVEIFANIDGAGFVSWGTDNTVSGGSFSVERTISDGDAGSVVLEATATGPGGTADSSTVSITVTDDLGAAELATWTGLQVWLDPLNTEDLTYNTQPTIADADMEAVGVGNWTVGNSATLTKEGSAYEGSQCLRVAYNGTGWGYAYQNIQIVGNQYRIQGAYRGDGSNTPYLFDGGTLIGNGTSANTWQTFDFEYGVTTTTLRLHTSATSAGYNEFDDLTLTNRSVTSIPERVGGGAFTQATAATMPWIDSTTGWLTSSYDLLGSSKASSDFKFLHDGTGMCIVCVATYSITTTSYIAGTTTDANTPGVILAKTTNDRLFFRISNGTGTYRVSATTAASALPGVDTPFIVDVMQRGDENLLAYIDGVNVLNDAMVGIASLSNPETTLGLFSYNASAGYYNGSLGEVLAFSRVLSASERSRLELFLATKHSITLP